MPIYEYECQTCGEDFEEIQRFSDPPLKRHTCSPKSVVRRKISLNAFQLKGGGWYNEGYARGNGESANGGDGKASAGNGKDGGGSKDSAASGESASGDAKAGGGSKDSAGAGKSSGAEKKSGSGASEKSGSGTSPSSG